LLIGLALINQLLFGVKVEDLGGEANVRVDVDAAGEELLENGRVSADEVDGAGRDLEGVSVLGDDGDRDGLGGLRFDEVLEVEQGSEVLLPLHSVVEAAVSDPFDGGVFHKRPAVADELRLRVREWLWERAEDELHLVNLSALCCQVVPPLFCLLRSAERECW
jgi:hypothetical protein